MELWRLAKWVSVFVLGAALCSCGGSDAGPSAEMQIAGSNATSLLRAGSSQALSVASGTSLTLSNARGLAVRWEAQSVDVAIDSRQDDEVRLTLRSPSGGTAVLHLTLSEAPADPVVVRVTVAPQRFLPVRRIPGERFSYARTMYYSSGTEHGRIDYHVFRVDPDGGYAMEWILPPELQTSTVEEFDAAGNRTLYNLTDTSNPDEFFRFRCEYEPAEGFREFPLFVGRRWSNQWLEICNPAEYDPDLVVATHEVVAYETVTVAAGSFDTLHIRSEYLGGQIVQECWWSPELGLDVKCRSWWRPDLETEPQPRFDLDLERAP